MKENLKISLDFVEGAIEEINYLIKFYKKNMITDEVLNKKLETIISKFLINVLAYVVTE